MLFMVIERFRDGSPVRERFQVRGRMLPEGVVYHASWVDPQGLRCFQVMEAASAVMLDPWINRWDDLIEFEIVPVLPSQEYWSGPV